jgi:hypothetical protein
MPPVGLRHIDRRLIHRSAWKGILRTSPLRSSKKIVLRNSHLAYNLACLGIENNGHLAYSLDTPKELRS